MEKFELREAKQEEEQSNRLDIHTVYAERALKTVLSEHPDYVMHQTSMELLSVGSEKKRQEWLVGWRDGKALACKLAGQAPLPQPRVGASPYLQPQSPVAFGGGHVFGYEPTQLSWIVNGSAHPTEMQLLAETAVDVVLHIWNSGQTFRQSLVPGQTTTPQGLARCFADALARRFQDGVCGSQ